MQIVMLFCYISVVLILLELFVPHLTLAIDFCFKITWTCGTISAKEEKPTKIFSFRILDQASCDAETKCLKQGSFSTADTGTRICFFKKPEIKTHQMFLTANQRRTEGLMVQRKKNRTSPGFSHQKDFTCKHM